MTEAPVSPLRRRMIEDMTIRKFAPRTQEGYIRAVKRFSAFLGAAPDTASFEDLRRYQLRLVASRAGVPTINNAVTALRFLFTVTLRKPEVVARLPFIREPRRLPVVLSPEEVARLLDAAREMPVTTGSRSVLRLSDPCSPCGENPSGGGSAPAAGTWPEASLQSYVCA
jgi:integrase/recombinase XerD